MRQTSEISCGIREEDVQAVAEAAEALELGNANGFEIQTGLQNFAGDELVLGEDEDDEEEEEGEKGQEAEETEVVDGEEENRCKRFGKFDVVKSRCYFL